jgi:hypothetical protein
MAEGEFREIELHGDQRLRLLGNVAIDGVVGAVPLVGDVFDVMWRSNRRNMRLLQEWLAVEERRGRNA